MKLVKHVCSICFEPLLGNRALGRYRSVYCSDCLEVLRGGGVAVEYPKFEWHNVKPTPPGTVTMLVAMADEIDRYLEAVKRD